MTNMAVPTHQVRETGGGHRSASQSHAQPIKHGFILGRQLMAGQVRHVLKFFIQIAQKTRAQDLSRWWCSCSSAELQNVTFQLFT